MKKTDSFFYKIIVKQMCIWKENKVKIRLFKTIRLLKKARTPYFLLKKGSIIIKKVVIYFMLICKNRIDVRLNWNYNFFRPIIIVSYSYDRFCF